MEYQPEFLKNKPAIVSPALPAAPVQTAPTAQSIVDKAAKDGVYYGNAIIRDYEKYSEKAYWDAAGKKWTVGWGFTSDEKGKPVTKDTVMDRTRADKFLADSIAKNRDAFTKRYAGFKNLTPNEQGAMLDLAHNLGSNWEKFPIVHKELSKPKPDRTVLDKEIPTFRKAGGVVSQGLVNRRKDTQLMFRGGQNYQYLTKEERFKQEQARQAAARQAARKS